MFRDFARSRRNADVWNVRNQYRNKYRICDGVFMRFNKRTNGVRSWKFAKNRIRNEFHATRAITMTNMMRFFRRRKHDRSVIKRNE